MFAFLNKICLLVALSLVGAFHVHAQESDSTYLKTEQLLNSKLDAKEAIATKSQRLLESYRKKIDRKFKGQKDSLNTPETRTQSSALDSMKQLLSFLERGKSKLGTGQDLTGLRERIKNLSGVEQKIAGLKADNLSKLQLLEGKIPSGSLKRLSKKYYYATSRMEYWKQKYSEPDELEEAVLEYLQGSPSFAGVFKKQQAEHTFSSSDAASLAELKNMGFQTKSDVSGMMQNSFGDRTKQLQEQMGEQVQQLTKPLQDVKSQLGTLNQAKAEAMEQLRNRKEEINGLKNVGDFRKNPMRELPFLARFNTQYTFQATRAIAGQQPAQVQLGANLIFNHTPRLSYGIGAYGTLGLGQDFRNIRLSLGGVGATALADFKWKYGISMRGGYEYGASNNADTKSTGTESPDYRTWLGTPREALYLGLMKEYKINKKWKGTFLLGYDFLWQQSALPSPLVIKLGIIK